MIPLTIRYIYLGINLLLFVVVVFSGCKKLVEIDAPVSSVNQINVFNNDATAISALNGIYTNMTNESSPFNGKQSISLKAGLSADELALFSDVTNGTLIAYYQNDLSVNNSNGSELWSPLYGFVYYSNSAIEGLEASKDLSSNVKKQLIGEAKFLRAFSYFYLINLFGEVPLVLTTNYKDNVSLSRASKQDLYQQIINDLKEALVLLSDNFLDGTLLKSSPDRNRPTTWAASALLARVYLYIGDWTNAEMQASTIINNSFFELSTLDKVFLLASLGNKEGIWQLQPTYEGWNTEDAKTFVVNNTPGDEKPVYLSHNLFNTIDSGDERKAKWIKDTIINGVSYPYAFKYKNAEFGSAVDEHLIVFRLAEQYLIRAEARAQLNNVNDALSDLNQIRSRANFATLTITDKNTLLDTILKERRIELFSEWGHRWLDLKRRGVIDEVMSVAASQKGGIWQSYKQLFPLPLVDLERDPNLHQNSGY